MSISKTRLALRTKQAIARIPRLGDKQLFAALLLLLAYGFYAPFVLAQTCEGGLITSPSEIAGLGMPGDPDDVHTPIANVRGFGASSDGMEDDTGAINRAIEAIRTIGKGTVFFPEGTYKVSGHLLRARVSQTVQ